MLGFLNRFVDSNDRELKRLQPAVDEANDLEAELEALSDAEIRARFEALRAEIREVAVPGEPSEDELQHPDPERRRELAKARRDKENERIQEALDDALPEVFAMTRRGHAAEARDAPLRRPADGRHGAPPGPDLGDADRRGQDARRAAGGVAQRDVRPRRPRGHRQRLPRQARPAVDGPDLPRPRPDGRHDPARRGFLFDPDYPPTDERLVNLRPVERQEAYAADVTYGTNNEFGFDYLRDNMVTELDRAGPAGHYFAIVDEVDNILIDEARTPLIISGQAEESADLYYTFARLVPRLRAPTGGRRGGRRLLRRPQGARRLPTEEGIEKIEKLARRREPLRRRSAAGPPLRAGPARPRPVQARPRLHRQGRRDRHRRRVHRPPDARPALVRGPAPGGRGQGGAARPARVGDAGHDHLPELLPAVRQARRA